jgi:Zn-dependent M28 family amino/carboxypeptidase
MPGPVHRGALPELTADQEIVENNLRKTVSYVAGHIGERSVIAYDNLQKTAQFIEISFHAMGYDVHSQDYTAQMRKVRNLVAELPGSSKANEIIVIGAHYDTVDDCPGADDNTSGVAGLLELARLLHGSHPERTIRFVAFVNEEPPWFQTKDMGSLVYAKELKRRNENVISAMSLETIGMYSDEEGSQQYPAVLGSLYPKQGNFIAFVGNVSSAALVRRSVASFRRTVSFPAEGAAAPAAITGVSWSDQWSFWEEGYPAVMVTDTAPFRNANYHRPTDTPDTLDYKRMALVVSGLKAVVEDLAR